MSIELATEERTATSPVEVAVSQELADPHSRLQNAANILETIERQSNDADGEVGNLIESAELAWREGTATDAEAIAADSVGTLLIAESGTIPEETTEALSDGTTEHLYFALRDLGAVLGDGAVEKVVSTIEGDLIGVDAKALGQATEDLRVEHSLGEGVEFVTRREGVSVDQIPYLTPNEKKVTNEAKEKLGLDSRNNLVVFERQSDIAEEENREILEKSGYEDVRRRHLDERLGTHELQPIEMFRVDIAERYSRPEDQRSGAEVALRGGEVRRPIMDISLADKERVQVQAVVERRNNGLDEAINILHSVDDADIETKQEVLRRLTNQLTGLLYQTGVWNRAYGEQIPTETNDRGKVEMPKAQRGTIADLYINDSDVKKYQELDALLELAGDKGRDSVKELTTRVIALAENMFPSGVEFVHATQRESLEKIVRTGGLATRSTVAHGTRRNTQLNGSFIHLTAPGSVAEEYGDVYIGIPVDTIMKYSPRMQLEDAYCGNKFVKNGKAYSTQEVMGAFTINNPMTSDIPAVFRAALEATHRQVGTGFRNAMLDQGSVGNYSFAASPDEHMASFYTYPFEELSIYAGDHTIAEALASKMPDKADSIYAHITTSYANQIDANGRFTNHSLSSARGYLQLPNFSLDGEVKVFAPMVLEEVPYVESNMAGSSIFESRLDLSPDTIDPSAHANYMSELIRQGYDPNESLTRAIESVNVAHGNIEDLIEGYIAEEASFEGSGHTLGEVISQLTNSSDLGYILSSYRLEQVDGSKRKSIVNAVGDSLFEKDMSRFVASQPKLEQEGYVFTQAQRDAVDAYKAKQETMAQESAQKFSTVQADDGWVF